jgi:hypothetical protein
MDQFVQVLGALLILAAFTGAQRGWLTAESQLYLLLNFVGASVLAFLAAADGQPGFLLLEFQPTSDPVSIPAREESSSPT